jgi:excisionase family DNA binding protein
VSACTVPPEANPALLLTIEDASKALRLGRTSIYSLLKDKRLDAIHISGRTLITAESVKTLIDNAPKFQSAVR